MSVEHLAVVLHHSKARGTAKLVLLGIANHQGDGGAWPSIATLARYANTEPRAVQKQLAKLVSSGELAVQVQAGGTADTEDHRRPNRYDVLVSCPAWCDRTPQHRDTRKLAGPQRSLWITGVSRRTPPVQADTRPPVQADTQTTHLEHVTPGPASTTDRARTEPCDDCGQPELACQRRQQAWPAEDRHPYARRRAPEL